MKSKIMVFLIVAVSMFSCAEIIIKSNPDKAEVLLSDPSKGEEKIIGKTPLSFAMSDVSRFISDNSLVTVRTSEYNQVKFVIPKLSFGQINMSLNMDELSESKALPDLNLSLSHDEGMRVYLVEESDKRQKVQVSAVKRYPLATLKNKIIQVWQPGFHIVELKLNQVSDLEIQFEVIGIKTIKDVLVEQQGDSFKEIDAVLLEIALAGQAVIEGNYREAITLSERIEKSGLAFSSVYIIRALAFKGLGMHGKAKLEIHRGLAVDPSNKYLKKLVKL